MKKVISIALAAIMLLCMIPTVAVFASTQEPTRDTSWYSDSASTFEISTAAQLLGFSDLLADGKNFSGKTVKLTADIDLNEDWTAGATAPTNVWADVTGMDFKGTFDGQAHEISGIYLKATNGASASRTAIFGGYAKDKATVKNVRIVNSYVEGGTYVGAIFGQTYGDPTIENVYCDVFVKTLAGSSNAQVQVGGLVGEASSATTGTTTISNCVFAGTVHATTTGTARAVGGLVGRINKSSLIVKDTAFYGEFYGQGDAFGGLVGRTENAAAELIATNCVIAGELTSTKVTYGGSYYGQTYAVKTIELNNCYHGRVTLDGTEQWKPLPNYTGYTAPSQNSTYDKTTNAELKALTDGELATMGLDRWICVENDYPMPRRVAALLEGEILEVSPMAEDHWYTLELEDETPALFVIDSAEDMLAFSEAIEEGIDFAGKTVELTCDVDLNEGWTAGATAPTNTWKLVSEGKAFAGTFDGKGNTVSGIYMNTQLAGMGIFGNVTGGQVTVKNFAIVNSYIESIKGTLGGLFGSVAGEVTVSGVYLDVDMVNAYTSYTDRAYGMGGFVGSVAAGGSLTFEDCVSAGYIKTTKSNSQRGIQGVGGFVGTADAQCNISATNSAFLGTLESKANVAGGFIGKIGDGTSTDVTVALTNVIIGGKLSTGDPDYNGSFCGQLVSGTLTATNCYHIKYNNAGELGTRPVYGTADESLNGATLVSDMDIRGADTSAWLTEKGLTEWTATDGYPLPTALVGMTSADAIPGLGDIPNDTVPEKPDDGSEDSDAKADGGDTEDDGGDETAADSAADDGNTEEKKGCGSAALGGIVLMTLAAGAATTLSRKKKEN